MGWWSATIMGGDTPLDAQCEIVDFLDINEETDDLDDDPTDEEIEAQRQAIVAAFATKSVGDWIEFLDTMHDEYGGIESQVAVLMFMEWGAPLPTELAERAIKACQEENVQGWIGAGVERRSRLDEFVSIIKSYDGTPTEVPQEGLFQTISAALDDPS